MDSDMCCHFLLPKLICPFKDFMVVPSFFFMNLMQFLCTLWNLVLSVSQGCHKHLIAQQIK